MGMKHIAQIVQRLIAAGRSPSEPLAFVTSATLEHQNVVESTLGTAVDDAKAAGVEPPAIICIGRSVLMRQVLDWRSLEAGAAPRNLDPLDRGRPAESA
jgi:uroporphyrin-III C-methyltransferase